jgi:hypothetical protein
MGCRAPKAAKGAQGASGAVAGREISMVWGVLIARMAREFTAVTGVLNRPSPPSLRLHTVRTHHDPSARRHGASRQSNGPLP